MFRSVFISGSDETIVRVKRSSEVILAIFGHFCKIEKAHIGAISWTDKCSVWSSILQNWPKIAKMTSDSQFRLWTPLFMFENWPDGTPCKKNNTGFEFSGYLTMYRLFYNRLNRKVKICELVHSEAFVQMSYVWNKMTH